MQQLTLPGKLDSLRPIRDFVRSVAGTAGLDKWATYRLALGVDEIATNIVTHGYDEAGLAGAIDIWCEMDAEALRIHIEDTGAPYDPVKYNNPVDIDQPLEERTVGGLGVFLATSGVDDLQYKNNDGKNRHTFIIRLGASSSSEAEK
jgi:anti-sigma regulatory factor (Ser/Thr protein kinase)